MLRNETETKLKRSRTGKGKKPFFYFRPKDGMTAND